MNRFEDLAKDTDFSDPESIERTLLDIQSVTDFDLLHWVVMGETLNNTARTTRKRIALARAEKERRDDFRSEHLARKITVQSARIAALATLLRAALGASATLKIGYLDRQIESASEPAGVLESETEEVGPEEFR